MRAEPEDDPVEVLRRWQDGGAIWRVAARRPGSVTLSLCQCNGGEEVSRFSSEDPRLLRFLAGRSSSEDDEPG